MATASYDSTIKVWLVEDGQCVQTLEGPDGDVEWIAWHKKSDVLLAGSKDGTVWMWLAPTGTFMQVRQLVCVCECVCVGLCVQ